MNSYTDKLESICTDLSELGMNHMADDLVRAANDPGFFSRNPLDVIADMIAGEVEETLGKRMTTRLRNAHVAGCPASIADCQDSLERTYLPMHIMETLSTLSFVRQGCNICIFGPSASGKTYLAKALTVEACRHWSCEYQHTDALLQQLSELHHENPGKCARRQRRLRNLPLLVLDDFLLHAVQNDWEAACLFSILDGRIEAGHSTIICSQRAPESWRSMLQNDQAIADSITTRATKDYTICIDLKKNDQ